MSRNALRVLSILSFIFLAALAFPLVSGYSELRQASRAVSSIEAAQHYRSAAQRIPWRSDLYELSGHAYYRAEEYKKADDAYQAAFDHRALSPDGWVAWGDVNYLDGDSERAVEIWDQAFEQPQPSGKLYSRLAEVYQTQGDYARAVEYLQKYLSAYPEDASAHYRLGLLLILSDTRQAVMELSSASGLDPQFGPAVETVRFSLNSVPSTGSASERFVMAGRGLGLVNQWKLAYAAFEGAVEADEKNAEAWAWLGEAKQQIGAPDAGMTELDQALSLDPNSAAVHGLRGLYFQRTGNFRQALAEFQTALSLEPGNPGWFVSIGEAHTMQGDLILALQAYQDATRLAPDDPAYWRLLAIFCAQNHVNITDIGVPAAQKAVMLTQADVDSLDVLGWLLLLDGRVAEAERMLVRALELDSQNASVHYHLGLLKLDANDRLAAYDHFIQARDLGSQDAEAVLNQYFP